MLFARKRRLETPQAQEDPSARRARDIEKLEGEREALTAEIESLVKEYSRAIGSREPIKGAKPHATRPNEYGFWHKKSGRRKNILKKY